MTQEKKVAYLVVGDEYITVELLEGETFEQLYTRIGISFYHERDAFLAMLDNSTKNIVYFRDMRVPNQGWIQTVRGQWSLSEGRRISLPEGSTGGASEDEPEVRE